MIQLGYHPFHWPYILSVSVSGYLETLLPQASGRGNTPCVPQEAAAGSPWARLPSRLCVQFSAPVRTPGGPRPHTNPAVSPLAASHHPGRRPQTPQNVTPQPHSHHPFLPPSSHVDLPRAVHPRSGPAPGPGHVQAALLGGFLPRSHRVCVPCTS